MKTQSFTFVFFVKIVLVLLSFASPMVYASNKAIVLDVTGAIGPATQDYIQRGLEYAEKQDARIVILRVNTPGGLDTSMRGINQVILASKIPVITFVAPQGARAASAGTFILYASQIAAMAPGTNVGAASPINIGGETLTPSSEEKQVRKSMMGTSEKKATQDAAAYIRSLGELQGRNVDWAEKAVKESVSLSAEEALKLKVIDVIAEDIPALLKNINDRTIKVHGTTQILQTNDLVIEMFKSDWRFQFLSVITDPTIAYILLLMGIYGLFFEFANPGFVLPGVAGAISLLLALYAFQLLPINYAGFALLFLGIIFMIVEAFVSSFGVLGIGGVIAFVAGSILLLETNVPGYSIAWQVILLMSLCTAGFFLVVMNLAIRSFRRDIVTGSEALIGQRGVVLGSDRKELLVRIGGEIWKAKSDSQLNVGQKIRIVKLSGLLLQVEPDQEK